MADGVVDQIKDVPKTLTASPWLFLGIGLLFLVAVVLLESFKPGLITGPIRRGLGMVGVKQA